MSVNKVIILGRLGNDPEVRNFQNGGQVVNFRVATSERFKDRDGNQQERTEWHSVAIFITKWFALEFHSTRRLRKPLGEMPKCRRKQRMK